MCFKSNASVALAAFWVNFCLLGVLRSNAVVFSGLVDVFGINRQEAAWPSGVFGFFMSITGAISGFLTNCWSIRSLAVFGTTLAALSVSICSYAYQMKLIIIFYGALQGIGFGLVIPLTHVVLNQNFSKYRAFAMGIAYSGSSAGSFVLPPIANYFVNTYNLDGAFLLLGGIMLNALIGAMMFKSPKSFKSMQMDNSVCNAKLSPTMTVCQAEVKDTLNSTAAGDGIKCGADKCSNGIAGCGKSTTTSSTFSQVFDNFNHQGILVSALEVLRNPKFLIICLAYALYFTSSSIFLMVILDFAKDRALEEAKGVFLVSAFSFGDLAGRLTCGWIADLKFIERGTLVRIYLIAMGTLLALLPTTPNSALTGIAVALGVISGGIIANQSVLLHEYLGIQKLPITIGFSTCFVGMSAFLRPVIIGYFRDYHQSYDFLFVFLGFLQIAVATLWFLEVIIPVVKQLFSVNKSVE